MQRLIYVLFYVLYLASHGSRASNTQPALRGAAAMQGSRHEQNALALHMSDSLAKNMYSVGRPGPIKLNQQTKGANQPDRACTGLTSAILHHSFI